MEPLENQDEDLIEGKNKLKIDWMKKDDMSIRIDTKFNWWKEQLFIIIRFGDSTVTERIKIILKEEAWDRIEKEYKKWTTQIIQTKNQQQQ